MIDIKFESRWYHSFGFGYAQIYNNRIKFYSYFQVPFRYDTKRLIHEMDILDD